MTTGTTKSTRSAESSERGRRGGGKATQQRGRRRSVDPELAALAANSEFQAAIEDGRASFRKGDHKTLDELDREKPLTAEQIAEADAWLDEYERRLEAESELTPKR